MLETFQTAAVNLPHPIASINYCIISIKKSDFLSRRQRAEREKNPSLLPGREAREDDKKKRPGVALCSSRSPLLQVFPVFLMLGVGKARFWLGPGLLYLV